MIAIFVGGPKNGRFEEVSSASAQLIHYGKGDGTVGAYVYEAQLLSLGAALMKCASGLLIHAYAHKSRPVDDWLIEDAEWALRLACDRYPALWNLIEREQVRQNAARLRVKGDGE